MTFYHTGSPKHPDALFLRVRNAEKPKYGDPFVAKIYSVGDDKEKTLDMARCMEVALNNHEALVDALTRYIGTHDNPSDPSDKCSCDACRFAHSVLSKVAEESV